MTAFLVGLATGAAVITIALRWGVWRWLAVLAAVPAVLNAPSEGVGASVLLLLGVGLLAGCWQARPHPLLVATAVAAPLLGVLSWYVGGRPGGSHPWADIGPTFAFLVLASLIGLAGAVGLARADLMSLRVVCGLLVGVPLAVRLVAGPAGHVLVAWWPAAAVVALTAMLRGRRSAASDRSQLDEIDREAIEAFDARYDSPVLAPVVIVIAAFDEAVGLPGVLESMPSTVCDVPADVLVVDDGSLDGTADAAEATGVAHVVRCTANRGQGAALRLGYRIAREHGAAYVLTTDADGQYDVRDLPEVLAPILAGEADFVTGSRRLGHQLTRDRVRRLGVHVFAWTVSGLVGRVVTDTSFGLRAIRAERTGDLTLNQPQYQSSELMIGAFSHGLRVREVPGTMHHRNVGTTKKGSNAVYGTRYARVVLGTWWREGCPTPVTEPAARSLRETLRVPDVVRRHRPFAIALGVGAALRVVAMVAFAPGFVFSDGPTYLALSERLAPSPDRVVGYAVFLRVLSWWSHDVWAIAVTQHLMGLLTAVVLYALLRRWDVSGLVATLATLPVLLDGMQVSLEHSVLSDVLFELAVVVGVAVLAWRRVPRVWSAALAGLVLAAAVLVRVAGEPVVVAAVVFCVAAAPTLRTRLTTSVALVAAFAVPLVAYAGWYHAEAGSWALTQSSGRALYMRTTGFVDCDRFTVPAYEQRLCPAAPVGQRADPTFYGWHDPDGTHGLHPPAGVTFEQAQRDFAARAIAAQPRDYAAIVARDFAMTFALTRTDRYEYSTAYKWNFAGWVDYVPTSWTAPAFASHGGQQLQTRQPWAGFLAGYGTVVYAWGPLLLGLLVLGLVGLLRRRPVTAPANRPLILLGLALGTGLVLVPDVTAEFTWRYVQPALVFLPMAAALAWARLRGSSGEVSPAPARRPARTVRTVVATASRATVSSARRGGRRSAPAQDAVARRLLGARSATTRSRPAD